MKYFTHEGDEAHDNTYNSQAGLVQSIMPGPSMCFHVRARAENSSVFFFIIFPQSLAGRWSVYPIHRCET